MAARLRLGELGLELLAHLVGGQICLDAVLLGQRLQLLASKRFPECVYGLNELILSTDLRTANWCESHPRTP